MELISSSFAFKWTITCEYQRDIARKYDATVVLQFSWIFWLSFGSLIRPKSILPGRHLLVTSVPFS